MSKNAQESRALALLFMQELLASVETLTGIAEHHGVQTLADLMYLQNAIIDDTFIDDHSQSSSKVCQVVQALPSGTIWNAYIRDELTLNIVRRLDAGEKPICCFTLPGFIPQFTFDFEGDEVVFNLDMLKKIEAILTDSFVLVSEPKCDYLVPYRAANLNTSHFTLGRSLLEAMT